MIHTATTLSDGDWKQLDERVRQFDEERWLSSRYAKLPERRALMALYALNYELARVRIVVTEPGLGAIRFQWWRDVLDKIDGGMADDHQVALALSEQVGSRLLNVAALQKLIDGHEAAFEAEDRAQEPEAHLSAVAARIFTSAHGWGRVIVDLAPHWAALRRGEAVGFGPVVAAAPPDIRPAIAHFRLRRLMAKPGKSGQFIRRLCIIKAMMSGEV